VQPGRAQPPESKSENWHLNWFEWLGVIHFSVVQKKEGHNIDIFIGGKEKILRELRSYNPRDPSRREIK
jgi:hypothetical protein